MHEVFYLFQVSRAEQLLPLAIPPDEKGRPLRRAFNQGFQ
jgi:hypothetical protein